MQTDKPENSHNHLKQTAPVIFLIIILFFSSWVRFEHITEQGISKGDSFCYMREAKRWAAGQPQRHMNGNFYRPVSFFLQGMAIRIFGYNDYSIKMLHGIMDMISIFLVFLIASILASELWAGVVSSLIYAFLPRVVGFTRSEMLHTESTFFVLLAFLFFILFAGKKTKNSLRFYLLFISGFCLGLAANTHHDLAFLAPGYIFYLFIKSYKSQNKKESLKKFLILAFIFSFAFFTPYWLGFLLLGAKSAVQAFFKEISNVQYVQEAWYSKDSTPLIFFNVFYRSLKYFFGKLFFLIGTLLIGAILIIISRKIKKDNDPLWAYLPLILTFSYAFLFSLFLSAFRVGQERLFLPLLPLVIFIITQWYHKIARQVFGKYSLIVFITLFFVLFLVNPKVIPGKVRYKSQYRLIYDILKDDVNSENKLLITPAAIYCFDRGFELDLYFGKNAIYMCHLPIKDEYSLKSLKELLKDINIRYIFLGKIIDRRFIRKDFPLRSRIYQRWFRNDNNPYTLEKDLKIIHAYIRSKGGLLINRNHFGKFYYLTGEKAVQKEPGLIPNGSFEHWWNGSPIGEWKFAKARISRSREATEGLNSIRFAPTRKGDKKRSWIMWVFRKPRWKNETKFKVRLDVKVGKLDKFVLFFTAEINGKRQVITPGKVRHIGKGEWVTLSEDFVITPGMRNIIFHLWLRPGAREPAFVDNLSIIPVRRDAKKAKKNLSRLNYLNIHKSQEESARRSLRNFDRRYNIGYQYLT